MKLRALVAGIAGSIAISSAALAADPIFIAPPPPMAVAPVGFDWAGPYVGGGFFFPSLPTVQLGLNMVRGNLIFGLEGMAGKVLSPGGPFLVGGAARAGFLIGSADRFAVYGTAVALYYIGSGGGIAFGAGSALGLGQRASAFAELYLLGGTGIRAGVNFQLGN